MTLLHKFFRQRPAPPPHAWDWQETLRYWLCWIAVIALLGLAMHRYFEHRDLELERRLERLKQ